MYKLVETEVPLIYANDVPNRITAVPFLGRLQVDEALGSVQLVSSSAGFEISFSALSPFPLSFDIITQKFTERR
jgi:hypothetical protein